MMSANPRTRSVPTRALILSLSALGVPVLGELVFPDSLGDAGALLWLLALIPAFLLAYYKGWRGVSTALAAGMATLSVTQAVSASLAREVPDLLLGVVVAYVGISLGIGVLAEILHRARSELEGMAFTDSLTQLPNRRHALLFLENEFAAAQRGRPLSVVLFDLDRFKAYNDTFGHQAGDEAIRAFGRVLSETTRQMNLSARFGGEEFLTALAGTDAEGAVVFAERVRLALQGQAVGDPPLSVSAGVATYDHSMNSLEVLLSAADRALYQAKRQGRNCVRLYTAATAEAFPQGGQVSEGTAKTLLRGNWDGKGAEGGIGQGKLALVVEDEAHLRGVLARYLTHEGFQVTEAGDGLTAISELVNAEFDIVLCDMRLPGAMGHEVVAAVKEKSPATQVIVITALHDARMAADALHAGADRYLFKPFGIPEFQAHIVEALSRRERLKVDAVDLAEARRQGVGRRGGSRDAVIRGAMSLARALEFRDPYTRGHSARVAAYASILAGGLDPHEAVLDRDRLQLACELHDVGMIGVRDTVLHQLGTLSPEATAEIREHPRVGRRILEPLIDDDVVLTVVESHHERWDGSGYPDGLAGEAIPQAARVVAVADALDAMTCPRVYRKALPFREALEQLRAAAGVGFDPKVVAYMEVVLPQLEQIHRLSPTAPAG